MAPAPTKIGGMSPFTLFAQALLAYSVHEHQEGHAHRIDIRIQPRSIVVQDDGRGMGLHREGYVENLMGLFGARAGAVQLHGVGLSLVASSTPRLMVESRRGGRIWTQTFSWGLADAPPSSTALDDGGTGTRVTVEVAPGSPDIDAVEVMAQVDRWRKLHPGLTFVAH
jgi:DNA gyrase/topoisomerase IV subunit B